MISIFIFELNIISIWKFLVNNDEWISTITQNEKRRVLQKTRSLNSANLLCHNNFLLVLLYNATYRSICFSITLRLFCQNSGVRRSISKRAARSAAVPNPVLANKLT